MSVFCKQGHENPDGSMFCDQCGEALEDTTSSGAAPAAAPYDATQATAPYDATPAACDAPVAAPPAPAPAATSARLVIKEDGAEFPLAGKSEFLVGREDPVSNIYPDIDLTPHKGEEHGVSRMHAKIYAQGSQYLIEDLNSTNSTYLNRQKLAAKTPTPIKDGDEVRFGKVEATFATA
ncbi:MAG TPA: FHA domain-containing protein [Ktedonobacterales bacterium]|jgi:pSer/pThr/pTyr-binding forkhead associated (FHA) protein|nr:FHA domain-containing protein [Ktedonobacterales bacterium]